MQITVTVSICRPKTFRIDSFGDILGDLVGHVTVLDLIHYCMQDMTKRC